MKQNQSSNKKIEALAQKLLTAGDPNRLKILCLIFRENKPCVSEIALKLSLSVAVTSHHLQALAQESLVEARRDGKRVCYALAESPFVADLKKLICKYK